MLDSVCQQRKDLVNGILQKEKRCVYYGRNNYSTTGPEQTRVSAMCRYWVDSGSNKPGSVDCGDLI